MESMFEVHLEKEERDSTRQLDRDKHAARHMLYWDRQGKQISEIISRSVYKHDITSQTNRQTYTSSTDHQYKCQGTSLIMLAKLEVNLRELHSSVSRQLRQQTPTLVKQVCIPPRLTGLIGEHHLELHLPKIVPVLQIVPLGMSKPSNERRVKKAYISQANDL